MSSFLVHGYIPCVLYPGAWVYTLCPLSWCMGIYLVSSILAHGYIPKVIIESVIVLPTLGTTLCPCVLYPGAWVYTLCPLSWCMGIYLVSSILVHGYIPKVIIESVIVLPTVGTTLCPCVLYPGAWVYTLCPLSWCMGIYRK